MSEDDPGKPPNPPSLPAAGDDHKDSQEWQEYLNALTCCECGALLPWDTLYAIEHFDLIADEAFCDDCAVSADGLLEDIVAHGGKVIDDRGDSVQLRFDIIEGEIVVIDRKLTPAYCKQVYSAPTKGPRRTLKKKYTGFVDKVRKEFADWRRELEETVDDDDVFALGDHWELD